MGKYLDSTGVTHLIAKIKALVASKADNTAFTGATSSAAGSAGLVPAPSSGMTDYVLSSAGSWANSADVAQSGIQRAAGNSSGYLFWDTGEGLLVDDGDTVLDVIGAQEALVSGTNIKTINNESLLGSGNISISGGSGSTTTWYGTCSTTASTAAKVVTCANFSLETGAIVAVLFTTANTAATPTLNVNSTGAKTIYVGNGTIDSTTNTLKWSANTLLYFMYDGTYFRYLGSQSAASIVPPEGAGVWYGTSSNSASTAAKTSTITNFKLRPGAIVNITFTTANTKIDTALTLNINSTGAKTIYVGNAATSSTNTLVWSANETLTFVYSGSYWYFVGRSGVARQVATISNMYEQIMPVINALGTQDSNSATSVSVATATNTNVVSIAPGEGVWMALGTVSYPSNGTGRRALKLSKTSLDSGNPPSSSVITAVSGAYTHMSTSRCFEIESDDEEIYLIAWQNSGSTLSCNGTIEVTRIA